MDPRSLVAVRLNERAECRQVHGRADAVACARSASECDGSTAEDLGGVAVMEIRGHPDDLGGGAHQVCGGPLELTYGSDPLALHHERDQDSGAGTVVHLAKIDRPQRAASRGLEGSEGASVKLRSGNHRSHLRRDPRQRSGQHPAGRDVDDLVSAALGEQPDLTARAHDELCPRAIAHDRLGRQEGLCPDEIEPRVSSDCR
jgi:hypothetical protein